MSRNGTADYSQVAEPDMPKPQPVGIYGWRKRCLYAFLLFLMVVVIMNLALTVWILRIMDFTIDGMGKLRITPKGLRLEGNAEFLSSIYAEHIQNTQGQDLYVESSDQIHLSSRKQGQVTSKMSMGESRMEVTCESFEIKDNQGKTTFLVKDNEVIVGTSSVEVIYSGVATFNGSIQTPNVLGPISEPFRLESKTSAVHVSGLSGVSLEAPSGDVTLTSQDNIRLQTDTGSIFLDSEKLHLMNLAVSDPSGGGQTYPDVYQLCVCPNGRLFLAQAQDDCVATTDICSPS